MKQDILNSNSPECTLAKGYLREVLGNNIPMITNPAINGYYAGGFKNGYTNIILQDGKLRCEDMDEIHDCDVVEFRYNPNGENGMIWQPLRIRRDKTPNKPQDFITAANVWKTITNPITYKMISGKDMDNIKKQIQNSSISEDYYIGESNNLDSLRKLHNFIKYNLIVGVGSNKQLRKNKNILDNDINIILICFFFYVIGFKLISKSTFPNDKYIGIE